MNNLTETVSDSVMNFKKDSIPVQLPNLKGVDSEDSYTSPEWIATFPGPLLSGDLEKDELMAFIRGKSRKSLQRVDEPQYKEEYFFWQLMELFCEHNKKLQMAKVAVCLFKAYRNVRKKAPKLICANTREDWCLPLAQLLCSTSPDDEIKRAVIQMGDDLANKGQTFASHICYVVAQVKLGTCSDFYFDVIGCNSTSTSLRDKEIAEAIIRAEVYEYMLFMTTGLLQPQFQWYKVFHASMLVEAGLLNLALEYCKTVAQSIIKCSLKVDMPMVLKIIEMYNTIGLLEPEEPEWLQGLHQMVGGQRANKTELDSIKEELNKRYAVGEKLGQGGMGLVYAGIRLADGKKVAIKYAKKSAYDERLTLPGETNSMPVEVALMRMVSEPPICENIVELLEWSETTSFFILVLERPSPCMDLSEFIHRVHKGQLPESLARKVMWQVTQAVGHCFERKVFHSDIKPENLLINTETLQVKLIDFGCGDVLYDTHYKQIAGTKIYWPPEWTTEGQYLARPATIWGLGLLLSNIIFGYVHHFPPNLSEECKHMMRSCLEEDPRKRATIEDIINHEWFTAAHKDMDVIHER